MNSFSKKEYLSLKMPTEEVAVSDQRRIQMALETLGYDHVTMPLRVIRKLYPMCRDANFDITVSLVQRETDWVVTDVEPGDRRQYHYGLAVDYGSTTIVMQLVDLNSGSVIAEEKMVKGQVQYGRSFSRAKSAEGYRGNLPAAAGSANGCNRHQCG